MKTAQSKEMFTGLKVLELASVLAGPSVGQFFAELGAEVIKVENKKTGGDVTRTWKSSEEVTDDRSAYFCSVNWGKKSVALDLSLAEDQKVVQKLASRSDVIIASFKPGDAEKFGVSYHQLSSTNQSLIYGQITGYGSDNDRVGYDAVLQAEAGFMDLNGDPGGPPTKMPVALIDVLAAHQLKEGLLLALLKRERTHTGSFVEVSLIQSAVASLVNQASNWLVGGWIPTRQGSAHPNIAPYGDSFETLDGKRILLAVGNDRQFEDLCEVLKVDTHATGVNFSSNLSRVQNREKLNELLRINVRLLPAAEFLKALHQRKVPAGLIKNVREAVEMTESIDLSIGGSALKGIRSFVAQDSGRWMGVEHVQLLPPPHFGEHTGEILASIRNF